MVATPVTPSSNALNAKSAEKAKAAAIPAPKITTNDRLATGEDRDRVERVFGLNMLRFKLGR